MEKKLLDYLKNDWGVSQEVLCSKAGFHRVTLLKLNKKGLNNRALMRIHLSCGVPVESLTPFLPKEGETA